MWWGCVLISMGPLVLLAQVGLWGLWGGHTSVNDLTASGEVWNRFYAVYGVGVRFLPERRLQPLIAWHGGNFTSQDRALGLYARTGWNGIGLGIRGRLRKGVWSPFLQVSAHRFSIKVRDQNDKAPRGVPSDQVAMGLSWGPGLSLTLIEGVELGILYQRFRPQTNLIEGLAGSRKDRIEAIAAELLFYFPERGQIPKSRF